MSKIGKSNYKDLQAVLLGWHKSGKTSVINNILGPSAAVAVSGQCVQKEGFVNGRRITLVDTPGWWKHCSFRDSAELTKQAIVRSVSLCPPGPHAFLLVIDADLPFEENYMKPLEKHLELLTEKVWSHTIVLFTGSDSLINIEERIQSQGEPLQRLLEKCGNRYHVFNANKHSSTQITELFEKIDDTVCLTCSRKFELELKVLQRLQRRWEEVQQRAVARREKTQEKRSMIKQKANVHHLEELRVVLLGWVLSGKSSAGNIILNKEEFVTKTRTTACKEGSGNVAGRKITALDTPGWWKFFTSEFNPESIQATILKAITQSEKFPHALLMVVPADTSFLKEHRRTIEKNMAIFGEQIWRHIIVLFTVGDFLGDASIEHHIESEGEALQWLVDKCGNRYHTFDKTKRGDSAQVIELLERIEEMVAGNCLFHPGVRELHEKIEPPVDGYEKHEAEEILKLIQKEWNKRVLEIQENVKKLCTEVPGGPRKSNQSRTPPPEFSEEDDSPDSLGAARCVLEMENSQKFSNQVSEKLKEQLISLLEREWSRYEAIVMEKVHGSLLKASEASSEVGEDEIHASVEKVLWWLPGCEQGKETHRSSDVHVDHEGGMWLGSAHQYTD